MNIQITDNCHMRQVLIDNEDFDKLSKEKKRDILIHMVNNALDNPESNLSEIVEDIVCNSYKEIDFKCDECNECGKSGYVSTYEIN